jgi:hypothetical protein
METFKVIEDFNEYEISDMGNVRYKGDLIKPNISKSGYKYILMNHKYGKIMANIHRLVALIFIENSSNGTIVDHIDRQKHNNCSNNLRWCSPSQNRLNTDKQFRSQGTSSKYKGVSWHDASKKWQVKIGYNRQLQHVGYYDTEDDAAVSYNKKATELYGTFARLNFIQDQTASPLSI